MSGKPRRINAFCIASRRLLLPFTARRTKAAAINDWVASHNMMTWAEASIHGYECIRIEMREIQRKARR